MYNPNVINLVAERYKARYNEQTKEVQKKLDEMNTWNWKEHQLIPLKKSKVRPQDGDLFVFQPQNGIFFMGRVLESKIVHKTGDPFIDGNIVVFLFRDKGYTMDRENFTIDYNNLLTEPMIITDDYWKQGFFKTIGNEPVSSDERKLDYGFFTSFSGDFMKADGTKLEKEPMIWGTYGIGTITKVAMRYNFEAIIDPSLSADKREESNSSTDFVSDEKTEIVENDIQQSIYPFTWQEMDNFQDGIDYQVSMDLHVGYKKEIFDLRAQEGFEGNGYDWESLANVYLCEMAPEISEDIQFNSEASVFNAFSSNREALREFVVGFKKTCENDLAIRDLFSRAELQ